MRVLLDKAGEGTSGKSGAARQIVLKPEYAALAGELPLPAKSFLLSFAAGAELPEETQENRRAIDFIRDEIALRPGAEVQVTGHTTRAGGNALNFALSAQRAEKFREYLISAGFPADQISAVGRGSLDPITIGPDEDRRNSRIEVIVR